MRKFHSFIIILIISYVCICVCICVCVYACVRTWRIEENVSEMSTVTGTLPVDSHGQHEVKEYGREYSTIDDIMQHHVYDHASSPVELSQKKELVTPRFQALVTALEKAGSAE